MSASEPSGASGWAPAGSGGLRIDKWLWYARVTKSRSLAQKLASGGSVRLNGDKISSASKAVKVGDVLTITKERQILILKVKAMATRRGSYPEACLLYEDLSPPPSPKADFRPAPGQRDAGAGRPTKRDRRRIHSFLGDD
ncbi:RNA-binding S4 domain-containing protein [Roseibium limicola]|uniref:RNA-binding S4 domain-containing protein n=1 Tax=Roseibium limicola TaxID=2816037 RepID=UPI002F405750